MDNIKKEVVVVLKNKETFCGVIKEINFGWRGLTVEITHHFLYPKHVGSLRKLDFDHIKLLLIDGQEFELKPIKWINF